MINPLKRRSRATQPPKAVARDPAARFARDLATQPPTKGVAALKAASDVYEASLDPVEGPHNGREPAERDA